MYNIVPMMYTLDELYNTQWLLFLFRRCAKDTHSARMCVRLPQF